MIDTATLRAISAARIAELGRQYLERAREEMNCIETLAQRADAAAFDQLAQLAHGMNGAGATLGFPELSTAAASVEALARKSMPGTPDRALSSAVRELRRRLAEAA